MPINRSPFYHSITRNLIVVFGTLFNNIKVVRDNAKEITVPIQYGSKEKWYIKKTQEPTLENPEAIILPRLGFVQTGFQFDPNRKLASTSRIFKSNDSTSVKSVFQPIPYIMNLELYLWSKTLTDGLQIMEQILPFFRPSFTVTMKELEPNTITRDVLITLEGLQHDDNAEGLFDSTRMLEWTFNFNIEANFYGPVDDVNIIKTVEVNTYIEGQKVSKLTGVPNPIDAESDDNWVFQEAWEEFPNIS